MFCKTLHKLRKAIDIAVISDTHLGTYGCKAAELLQYLKSIKPEVLILNGDIIDGWQFSKSYFPELHMKVIKEIFSHLSKGTKVYYLTGNHDDFLRKFSDFKLGNFYLKDKLLLSVGDKKAWIFHGDVFDLTMKSSLFWAKMGAKGFGILMILNRFVNKILSLIGKNKISLSKKALENMNKRIKLSSNFEEKVSLIATENAYDYVICGHIHIPEIKELATKNGNVCYLNSGDWVENCTSLEFFNNTWHLYQYNKSDFENEPEPNDEKMISGHDFRAEIEMLLSFQN